MAKEIAHWHHERWDGNGYPDRLRGEAIPLPARIMALADVYDALSTLRVYKPKLSHEESMAIIVRERGQQFDPELVDLFVSIGEKIREVATRLADTAETIAAKLAPVRGDPRPATPTLAPLPGTGP